MPLTYDDREDLYIKIEQLRRSVAALEKERDYWRHKYYELSNALNALDEVF